MQEIEKTYLIKAIPDGLAECGREEIWDIYFPKSTMHPKSRLRKIGDSFEITKKERNYDTASVQDEHTISLEQEEFEALSQIEGKELRKLRYYYDHDGRTSEVDVYLNAFEGLVTADFEFETREELDSFKLPSFCLADVSEEDFIAAGLLAGKSYADIETELAKYDYHPLKIPENLKQSG